MGLQKRINKRLIKRAIGGEYVYQIDADEKIRKGYIDDDEEKDRGLKGFLKDGVKEMKKEVRKKLEE